MKSHISDIDLNDSLSGNDTVWHVFYLLMYFLLTLLRDLDFECFCVLCSWHGLKMARG